MRGVLDGTVVPHREEDIDTSGTMTNGRQGSFSPISCAFIRGLILRRNAHLCSRPKTRIEKQKNRSPVAAM